MHHIPLLCNSYPYFCFSAFSLIHTFSLSLSLHIFSASSTFSFCLPDPLSCQSSGLSPRDQLVQTGRVASSGVGPISAVFIVLTSENKHHGHRVQSQGHQSRRGAGEGEEAKQDQTVLYICLVWGVGLPTGTVMIRRVRRRWGWCSPPPIPPIVPCEPHHASPITHFLELEMM